jgi:hypothetical protein
MKLEALVGGKWVEVSFIHYDQMERVAFSFMVEGNKHFSVLITEIKGFREKE